jgi:hypothetical protein
MIHVNTLRGYRPLAFVPDGILLAQGYDIFIANLDCSALRRVATIPHSWTARVLRRSRLFERILRFGIRFGCRIAEGSYLLAERNRIWRLDLPQATIQLDHVAIGKKPLWIARIQDVDGFSDGACYGEYWDNVSKEAINIWVRSEQGVWRVAHTFPKGTIEHVHGIVPDRNRGVVWIVTGDFGESAGIWAARRDFNEVLPVLVGQQDYRCCWLACSADHITYATDSPLVANSVRRLVLPPADLPNSNSWAGSRSIALMDISGSSIYGCTLQDRVVFSTTVEPGLLTGRKVYDWLDRRPGPGIKGMYSDLMVGTDAGTFVLAGRWMKDRWPARLCEFGSISFPTGVNPSNRLYAYFTGLSRMDGCMSVFDLQ